MKLPFLPHLSARGSGFGVVLALTSLLAPFQSASALTMKASAQTRASAYAVPLNESYLNDTQNYKEESLSDEIFDARESQAMQFDYRMRQYAIDREARYGTLDAHEKRKQEESMQSYSQTVVDSVGKSYMKRSVNRWKKQAIELTRSFREPLAVGFLVASTLSGKEMKVRVMRDVYLRSRTRVQDGSAQVGLQLPGVSTQVAYHQPGADSKVSAQISKQLTDRWSAVYDSASRGTWRLNYGVSF